MKKLVGSVIVLIVLAAGYFAWTAFHVPTNVERKVEGQTLISPELPAASFNFADGLSYLGGQRFALYVHTDAEQHFFVDADQQGQIRRLYWVQFEHKLPGNFGRYIYTTTRTAQIGGLSFLYDTKIYTDYVGLKAAPGSDVEKARVLLAAHGLHLPRTAMRARMFHPPTEDGRSELMLIYVEALSPDDMPKDAANEMAADDKYPALSQALIQHAQQSLNILPAR
jgi:hypothetical protein